MSQLFVHYKSPCMISTFKGQEKAFKYSCSLFHNKILIRDVFDVVVSVANVVSTLANTNKKVNRIKPNTGLCSYHFFLLNNYAGMGTLTI